MKVISVQDPEKIGMYIDLLIKIKNAQAVKKPVIKTRYTRNDRIIAEVLQKQGFITSVEVKGRLSKRFMYVNLEGSRAIESIRFLSKPSASQYTGYKNIKKVKSGYGLLILSTPKGIMSGDQAKLKKVGGQLLCKLW